LAGLLVCGCGSPSAHREVRSLRSPDQLGVAETTMLAARAA
jgi:hypothetical protein